ncbi:MAG: hypothetical protein AABY01_02695 [Nanoarchaeota archaeon]
MPTKRKASKKNHVAAAKKNNKVPAVKKNKRIAAAKKTTAHHLLAYYGNGCPHCDNMDPLIRKLERELHVKVIEKEVWHNDENAEELSKVDNGKCGGVPFFYNAKNKKWICGQCDYDELKKWAK